MSQRRTEEGHFIDCALLEALLEDCGARSAGGGCLQHALAVSARLLIYHLNMQAVRTLSCIATFQSPEKAHPEREDNIGKQHGNAD